MFLFTKFFLPCEESTSSSSLPNVLQNVSAATSPSTPASSPPGAVHRPSPKPPSEPPLPGSFPVFRHSGDERGLQPADPVETFQGKFVAIFFGADWCPFCKSFCRPLISLYNMLRPSKMFEVVYVPCDRSREAYLQFSATMPWCALPLQNYGYLVKKYQVRQLPWLTIVDPNDNIIFRNAVDEVREQGSASMFLKLFSDYTGPIKLGDRSENLFTARES
uniref:Thioredoxin domain-containing protein n=1 Tax=Chromera velia CCMP2878 TaxID=1169474 RepID=A0A0G4H1M3_9ALVE|eukprot:Cvel_798.t1-p1 / transcript=Cvel_798.t1 / gene=Cvel_798 / organism=Chromera_velia_CCMP2878 / gene_product=Nucleoredoxin, putative / transcript_product=Nucleoredoxin, putative / location=Cvel_scaffold25:25097-25750(-) / protein_length=218 / sequence_SO=supercontig / SO=protein_coding / is_pseudo=false